jgi:hypothetical protein
MRYIIFNLYTLFASYLYGQETVIRVTENPLTREYKLLYTSPIEQEVIVSIFSFTGAPAMEEKFNTKTFVKKYTLKESALGKYYFQVKYGNEIWKHDFEIMNEKKIMKESIAASLDDLLNLKIDVKPYNELPLSLFLYNISGKQLDHVFWEPTKESRQMVIPLTKYDAYDIKLEILQQGDVIISQTFKLY